MATILVSGLINVETTLRVEHFPVEHTPVRYPFFGVQSTVSGVGFNVARALAALGDDVRLLSLIGDDPAGELAAGAARRSGMATSGLLHALRQTPQSVILYDGEGRRQINVDLKDIQEQAYPVERFAAAVEGCALAILCNVNFSRPLLAEGLRLGLPLATDVHAIADLDDAYNRDFMAAARILFMSHEHLPTAPEAWAAAVQERYGTEIIGIGLGSGGALLAVRSTGALVRVPAVTTRPVVSTIGAGDALFSAFVHVYAESGDPYAAMRKAVLFASYKIGEASGSAGFLDAAGLDALAAKCK